MTLSVQDYGFSEALALYVKATGKTMVEAMNRAAGQVALRSIRTTKEALEKWPIRKQDKPPQFTKKGKRGADYKKGAAKGAFTIWTAPIVARQKRLYFALASKKGIRKGGGALTKGATRIHGQRRSAKGYTAASWVPAIRDLGQTDKIPGRFKGFKGRGMARYGGGWPATEKVHASEIMNTAPMSEALGFGPMETAAAMVIADMTDFAMGKLKQTAKEVSGKS